MVASGVETVRQRGDLSVKSKEFSLKPSFFQGIIRSELSNKHSIKNIW